MNVEELSQALLALIQEGKAGAQVKAIGSGVIGSVRRGYASEANAVILEPTGDWWD